MARLRPFRAARVAIFGGFFLSLDGKAMAQGEPQIDHEAEDCLPEDQYPALAASIEPGKEILSAKVYFRSDRYPDFYYVEMKGALPSFLAILPKPGPETERVIYYVEAIDSTFNGSRTEEYDPEVKEPCKRRGPAAYTGTDPGIIVGATKAGVAAIPPGFQAVGIAGFITAAGVGAGVGGFGVGTAVAVAGVAAAAGGAVVVAGGETTTSVAPSAPPSTTSAPPAGTSTSTVPPATTTTSRSTTSTTTVPTATTTIASTTTTTAPATTTTSTNSTVTACFTATKLNSCVWSFDASCSTGPINQYNWVIDPAGIMPGPRPPVNHSGPTLVVDWNPPAHGGCSGSPTISVQLTVVGSGGQTDTKAQGVRIDLKAPGEDAARRASFTSFLSIPPQDGSVRGFLVLNDASWLYETSNSLPASHAFRAKAGENVVEAHLATAFRESGFWKFDFSATDHFVSGSIRVRAGVAASVDGRSILCRLTGEAGERIRFSFELEP